MEQLCSTAFVHTALDGKAGSGIEVYPALNHPLVAGEGLCAPQEYDGAGHVDPAVVTDVAARIKGG